MATAQAPSHTITNEERKVIFASSLGTVFEWYDFYLYGSLAAIIAKQFFAGTDPNTAFIFALLAFAAGFLVRPFGALVFGRFWFRYVFCRAWRSAASTVAQRLMWLSMRRIISAAHLPRGFKQPQRWACSCR